MGLRWLLLAISLFPLYQGASAKEILELHMPDAPPLTFISYQGGYGMVGDVALAAYFQGRLLESPAPDAVDPRSTTRQPR